jgi:hypothetical protein
VVEKTEGIDNDDDNGDDDDNEEEDEEEEEEDEEDEEEDEEGAKLALLSRLRLVDCSTESFAVDGLLRLRES